MSIFLRIAKNEELRIRITFKSSSIFQSNRAKQMRDARHTGKIKITKADVGDMWGLNISDLSKDG